MCNVLSSFRACSGFLPHTNQERKLHYLSLPISRLPILKLAFELLHILVKFPSNFNPHFHIPMRISDRKSKEANKRRTHPTFSINPAIQSLLIPCLSTPSIFAFGWNLLASG